MLLTAMSTSVSPRELLRYISNSSSSSQYHNKDVVIECNGTKDTIASSNSTYDGTLGDYRSILQSMSRSCEEDVRLMNCIIRIQDTDVIQLIKLKSKYAVR